jgi:hypothetical protein
MASWSFGSPEVYASVVRPPALEHHIDASEAAVCLTKTLEWNQNMNLPAIHRKTSEDRSVPRGIGMGGEDPVEAAVVADDHRCLVVGRLVQAESRPGNGACGLPCGPVAVDASVDDRFGFQQSRFVREHLASLSYTSVVHVLVMSREVHSLLWARRFLDDESVMKNCTHLFTEQDIGAGLVRKICRRCSTISIGERPRLGADPWHRSSDEGLSGSQRLVLAG